MRTNRSGLHGGLRWPSARFLTRAGSISFRGIVRPCQTREITRAQSPTHALRASSHWRSRPTASTATAGPAALSSTPGFPRVSVRGSVPRNGEAIFHQNPRELLTARLRTRGRVQRSWLDARDYGSASVARARRAREVLVLSLSVLRVRCSPPRPNPECLAGARARGWFGCRSRFSAQPRLVRAERASKPISKRERTRGQSAEWHRQAARDERARAVHLSPSSRPRARVARRLLVHGSRNRALAGRHGVLGENNNNTESLYEVLSANHEFGMRRSPEHSRRSHFRLRERDAHCERGDHRPGRRSD